jgi:hypothetical protein
MVLVAWESPAEIPAMDAFFTELGRTVLARWKKENFSLAAFPDIARGAIDERPPARKVDLAALAREFLLDDEQPFQTASGFGQPELVVYDDPRFYIQILFWLEGTTQIHQHEFSGAFHVLEGSSLHSEFEFTNAQPVSAHFRVGDLRLKHTQLLTTGRTVPIVSGGGCIHSLFHLDTPSVTVVVRTHSDPGTGPQFTYLPPHIAVDPFFTDALTTRRTQLLDLLERTDDPGYAELVREMAGELDLERGFFILQNCMGHLRNLDRWDEVWDAFRQKHGALADRVLPTLDELVWRDTLVGFRSSISEVEHRFFLALLLNVPMRADLLKLVAERFTGNAVDTVLRWAGELGETSDFGATILDAEFPAELDFAAEEQLDVFLAALRFFLEAGEGEVVALSRADVELLRGVFAWSSLRALVA